ncbi:MAG: hypothetical protein ACN2B6_00145 [Rickettsiales bacterium]
MSSKISKKIKQITCQCGGEIMLLTYEEKIFGVCRKCLQGTKGYQAASCMFKSWEENAPSGKLEKLPISNKQLSMVMLASRWRKAIGDDVTFNYRKAPIFSGVYKLNSDEHMLLDNQIFIYLRKLPGSMAPLRECH